MVLGRWSVCGRGVVTINGRTVMATVRRRSMRLAVHREGSMHRARRHQTRLADEQGEPETDDDRERLEPGSPAHTWMI